MLLRIRNVCGIISLMMTSGLHCPKEMIKYEIVYLNGLLNMYMYVVPFAALHCQC